MISSSSAPVVWLTSSVAPVATVTPDESAMAPAPERANVPPLIVVVPLKAWTAVKVCVPLPVFITFAAPSPSLITPSKRLVSSPLIVSVSWSPTSIRPEPSRSPSVWFPASVRSRLAWLDIFTVESFESDPPFARRSVPATILVSPVNVFSPSKIRVPAKPVTSLMFSDADPVESTIAPVMIATLSEPVNPT